MPGRVRGESSAAQHLGGLPVLRPGSAPNGQPGRLRPPSLEAQRPAVADRAGGDGQGRQRHERRIATDGAGGGIDVFAEDRRQRIQGEGLLAGYRLTWKTLGATDDARVGNIFLERWLRLCG